MVRVTLASLLFRDEVFWVGVALYLVGVLAPLVPLGTTTVGVVLAWFGVALLVVRAYLALFVILLTTYEGWRYGYVEGRLKG